MLNVRVDIERTGMDIRVSIKDFTLGRKERVF
jgi:hypothetical protein